MLEVSNLISWETQRCLSSEYRSDLKLELSKFAKTKLQEGADRVELFFKLQYVRKHILNLIEGVVSTLTIDEYDSLKRVLYIKVNMVDTINSVYEEVTDIVNENGLESIIDNFEL
jgi:hypothetical protein